MFYLSYMKLKDTHLKKNQKQISALCCLLTIFTVDISKACERKQEYSSIIYFVKIRQHYQEASGQYVLCNDGKKDW